MSESMRIQRALARAGVASRRRAEELVSSGRVKINGVVAVTGQSVDTDDDVITVDDKPVTQPVGFHWMVLNKPAGVLTTKSDPRGRRTVFDLITDKPGLTYVGRLDYMTEGVLILTTDGETAHKLTHPSTEVERTYVATVRGDGPAAVRAARNGIELEDGFMKPIATLRKPLPSVHVATKQPSDAAFERSDICAVAAASVVGEAMVAAVLADALLEKFGGDSLRELRRNLEGFRAQMQGY